MKIILVHPQIPQNAGNIARTCAVTGTQLILVKPLGFSLAKRHLIRAGLDYWDQLDVEVIDDLIPYLENAEGNFYFFSSKATSSYVEASYRSDAILIFGSETSGLPPLFHTRWPDRFLTIPMKYGARCLNLANSAAIVLYEALRQQNFCFSPSL